MSGFTGKTETVDSIPSDLQKSGARGQAFDWLLQRGFGELMPGAPDLQPFRDLFTRQRGEAIAQAKESTNLTGSGFANNLGKTVNRSLLDEEAFLANLLNQNQQANANRFLGFVNPLLSGGVGPSQQVYKPGFTDYLFQGGAALAGAAGQSGGFGKLF
jgi:hypothetical protein